MLDEMEKLCPSCRKPQRDGMHAYPFCMNLGCYYFHEMQDVEELKMSAVDPEKAVKSTQSEEPNVEISGGQGGRGGRGGNAILSSGALGEVFDIVVKKLREGLEAGGGNTLIASGVGYGQQSAGDIIFNAGNLQVLRIDANGDFFYKGEKLDRNEDVAFVLRAWLGYCPVVMNRENRVRFEGEARIGELEAQLLAVNKAAERSELMREAVEKGRLQADTGYEAWRKWASETLGKYPGLGEADSTLREGVTKHIAYFKNGGAKILQEAGFVSSTDSKLEAQLKVVTEQRDALWKANEKRAAALAELEAQLKAVTEQRDARVKDEDVPELFAAGQRARALEDDLSAWREWACLQSGLTYMGEADSWLRVRVQDALQKSPQKMVAEASPPLALTREEILFVRDAFQAAKRSSPYGISP